MPTLAHRSIRHCLHMIGPFCPSPALPEEGQRQLYDFFTFLYRGMLENPEGYFVFPGPYEAWQEKNKARPDRPGAEKAHRTDSRESTLRNTVQQAISFYAAYLWQLGIRAEGTENGALVLGQPKYQEALAHMARFHGPEHHPARYALLEKAGLETIVKDGSIHIRCRPYPRMTEALLFLCRAKETPYKFMNYLRLDFENAGAAPTVSTICRTLTEEGAAIIRKMEESLASLPVKAKIRPLRGITSDFQWKVEYVCKGKNVLGFYADHDRFLLCVYFNDHKNISAFASLLQQNHPSLFPWFCRQFPERLCRCPSNRLVHLGDEKRRICGLSNRAEIPNPSPQDVENALFVLRTFRGL